MKKMCENPWKEVKGPHDIIYYDSRQVADEGRRYIIAIAFLGKAEIIIDNFFLFLKR